MQQKISMDLLNCNSEDEISLDEIVQALYSAYESKAFARIILKRHANPEEWRKYWEQRNQPNGKVMAFVQNYRCSSTNFAHLQLCFLCGMVEKGHYEMIKVPVRQIV